MSICNDNVVKLANKIYQGKNPMSKKALDEMLEDIESNARRIKYQNPAIPDEECFERAADRVQDRMAHKAYVIRNNAYLNVLKRGKNLDYIKQKGYDAGWLQAFLDGNPLRGGKGARDSLTNNIGGSLMLTFGGRDGLITRLKSADVYNSIFLNKKRELDLAEGIWKVRHNQADQIADKDVRSAAEIINDVSENLRKLNNKAGADIGYLAERVTGNRHNVFKMVMTDRSVFKDLKNKTEVLARNKGNMKATRAELRELAFKRWSDFELNHLDHNATFVDTDFSDEAKTKFMRSIWNGQISRCHERMDLTQNGAPDVKRGASFASRLKDKNRVLIYKSAADELAHLHEYGFGTLKDSVLHDLETSSISRAILDKLGPNADYNYEQMSKAVRVKAKEKGIDVKSKILKNDRIWRRINGTNQTPVNYTMARIGSNIRAYTNLAKLGFVTIRSIPDLAISASELRHHGIGFFDSWASQLDNLRLLFPVNKDMQHVFDLLGTTADHMIGSYNRFGINDGVGGLMSDLNRLYFKMNYLKYWDYALRQGTKATISRWLALNKDYDWGALNKNLKYSLELRGLGEKEWELMRHYPMADETGRQYIMPDAYRSASDEHIAQYLGKDKFSTSEKEDAIRELEVAHMSYLHDIEQHVILTPTARDQTMWLHDHPPGTVLGEALRMISQFKMFSTGFSRRIILGSFNRTEPSKSSLIALTEIMASTAILSYISKQGANILHNRTIQDPRLIKDPGDKFNFYMETLAPAFGILGDTIASEYNYNDSRLEDTFGGPVMANVDDLYKMFQEILSGTVPTGKALSHFAEKNVPLVNTFGFLQGLQLLTMKAFSNHIDQHAWNKEVRNMRDKYGEQPLITPF